MKSETVSGNQCLNGPYTFLESNTMRSQDWIKAAVYKMKYAIICMLLLSS